MTTIVKIGGNVIDNELLLSSFLKDFVNLPGHKVLVHGGGVMASRLQQALGIEPVLLEGRRVTDGETLKLVTMVYAGWCNKTIVASLQALGCDAVGLSGADGKAVISKRRSPEPVDYGCVGDVEWVNTGFLKGLMDEERVPVLCAITADKDGNLLNTNADTIAARTASALAAYDRTRLIYCFEKPGVLRDADDDSSVIPLLDRATYADLKESGAISKGMVPKLDNAFSAIDGGVSEVIVTHCSNLLKPIGTLLQ